MKLKLALAALLGILAGAAVGLYAGFATNRAFVDLTLTSQIESRFADRVLLLKQLDDGDIDRAKRWLLNGIQSDTIIVGAAMQMTADDPRHLRRFIRYAGELKSVREDGSDLGKAAAKVRDSIGPLDSAPPAQTRE